MSIEEATRYSSSIPILTKSKDDTLDGGLGANNPSIFALSFGKQLYPGEPIVVLYIGTGYSKPDSTFFQQLLINLCGPFNQFKTLFEKVSNTHQNQVDYTMKLIEQVSDHKQFNVDWYNKTKIDGFETNDEAIISMRNEVFKEVIYSEELLKFLCEINAESELQFIKEIIKTPDFIK